jgi:hypothetical protein
MLIQWKRDINGNDFLDASLEVLTVMMTQVNIFRVMTLCDDAVGY